MKIISVGDLHGRDVNEDVRGLIDKCDKMIFTGDYVDSFERTDLEIIDCLRNTIQFKKDYPEKVELLWGNHDVQYLLGYDNHGCSGYRPSMKTALYAEFSCNRELFKLAFQHKDWIWTHAGITDGWWLFRYNKYYQGLESIADELNAAFDRLDEPIFDVGHRRGGYLDVGGPLWCDRKEILNTPLKDYNQIVGHTKREFIETYNYKNHQIVFIDVLENDSPEFRHYTLNFNE